MGLVSDHGLVDDFQEIKQTSSREELLERKKGDLPREGSDLEGLEEAGSAVQFSSILHVVLFWTDTTRPGGRPQDLT